MAVRSPFAGYLPLVVGVRSIPVAPVRHESIGAALRAAAKALRRGSVLRWLTVLEATDLMGDVLLGYLALYFVDVVGLSPVAAAGVIVIWTVAGLVGDALLLLVLEHASGVTYLRLSAVTALFVLPRLRPGRVRRPEDRVAGAARHTARRLVCHSAGRLFAEMREMTGTAVALSSLGTAAGSIAPLAIGLFAERAGLQATLWIALLAPVALLALARRESTS